MTCHRRPWTVACALFAALIVAGCGNGKDPKAQGEKPATPGHKAHGKGPHGGSVIELGAHEYHAELTHDHDKNIVTIYIWDNENKKSVPITDKDVTINLILKDKSSQGYKLPAKPQTDDPAGQSSRFELADKKLVDALEAEGTEGKLLVTINGKSYVGDVKHED